MACNCSGGKRERRSLVRPLTATAKPRPHALVMPDGNKIRYGSKLEADAANVRAKYRGRVEPA